jgi:hypothetical protein
MSTKRRSIRALRHNTKVSDRREVSIEVTEGDRQVWLAIKSYGETTTVSGHYVMSREDWDRLRGVSNPSSLPATAVTSAAATYADPCWPAL